MSFKITFQQRAYVNSCNICVGTTSLIRKIDRALFTFWLYIICRRRCVILIFIFFLFFWFSVHFVLWYISFCLLRWLHGTFSVVSVVPVFYLRFMWPKYALFSFVLLWKNGFFFCIFVALLRLLHYFFFFLSIQIHSAIVCATHADHGLFFWPFA